MRQFINKAKHNEDFLTSIESHFPDNYLDWKLVVTFYSALHYLNAYCKFKKVPHPHNHKDRKKLTNPDNPKALMPSKTCYEIYTFLYDYAHTARYMFLYSQKVQNQFAKIHIVNAKNALKELKEYFVSNDMVI